MAKAKQQDLFMQWFPISVQMGADSSDLQESEVTTGLSIRGEYAWLIHVVEFHLANLEAMSADQSWSMALSTVGGQTSTPEVSDKGTICRFQWYNALTTSGEQFITQPFVWRSLPPTIIASPTLSLYAKGENDISADQNKTYRGRIGYTTIPIEQKTYLEIAETFETL